MSVFYICILVQYHFVSPCVAGFFPLQYLIFLAGALSRTSPVSRRLNAVCTEENIFKPCLFSIFDNVFFLFFIQMPFKYK